MNSTFRPTPYHLIGWVGFLCGVALNFYLANRLGYSLRIVAGYCGLTIVTFYSYAMITKIVKGYEELIYYRHEIAALVVTAIYLNSIDGVEQPALYLDMYILGLGLFLVFGRIGCFLSGCCYGKPHRCGKTQPAERGYPAYLKGVPLLPTQLLESAGVLVVVIAGVYMLLDGHQPGEALLWHVFAYGSGRFILEYFRGDERNYILGLSEAQWTTLALVSLAGYVFNEQIFGENIFVAAHAISESESSSFLTFFYKVNIVFLSLAAVSTLAYYLIFKRRFAFFSQAHLDEVLSIIYGIENIEEAKDAQVQMYRTSQGLHISGQWIQKQNEITYTFSFADSVILYKLLQKIGIIFVAGKRVQSFTIRRGNAGLGRDNAIFHLICVL